MENKLSSAQRKYLKGLAHSLDPAVALGKQGLTESVLKEVTRQLLGRELIKIKLEGDEKQEREETADMLCTETASHLVNIIGKIAIVYRAHPEKPVIKFPKAGAAAKPKMA